MQAEKTKEERRGWGQAALRALFPEFFGDRSRRGIELLLDAVVFGIALLFARTHLLFGMYPFALSYVAARRRRVIPAFLGAFLGSFGLYGVGPIYSLALCLLLLLRLLFSLSQRRRAGEETPSVFHEEAELSVLAATLVGASLALYEVGVAGIKTYTLLFAAAALLAPTLFTFLFVGIYETKLDFYDLISIGRGKRKELFGRVPPPLAELSVLALLFAFCFSLSSLSLFGLSLSACFTVAAVFFIARRFGGLRAAVTGLVLGLSGEVLYAPAYAFLGLLSGLLFPLGSLYAFLAGVGGATVYAGAVGNLSGFLSVVPEASVTALVIWPIFSRLKREKDPAAEALRERSLTDAVRGAVQPCEGGGGRLVRLGDAFSELSGVFYRRSDESRRPAAAEYFVECEKVCARHCAGCSNRVVCWEKGDRVAEGAVYALANKLRTTGVIDASDLPKELRVGCPRIEQILEEIRDECAGLCISRYRGDRNEFLSLDYAMLSKILSEAAEEDARERAEDAAAAGRLREALEKTPLRGACLSVTGVRRRRVAVGSTDISLLKASATPLREAAERALGCRLSEPEYREKEGVGTLLMHGRRSFAVQTATASLPASRKEPSGDKIRFFVTEEDGFYGILSDGMGSGEEAAETAALSVTFLEKMLLGGNSRETSLRMLNNLIRTGRQECSATVDMLSFDLLYGTAMFIKSGAAPSYIKRGGDIFRVRSRTMPLGLLKALDAERVNVEVKVGDILLLLSDGLCPEGDDPPWLMNLLSSDSGEDLDALAKRIVEEASTRTEGHDDISVGLVRIEEEKGEK